jgi:hypothetical protein
MEGLHLGKRVAGIVRVQHKPYHRKKIAIRIDKRDYEIVEAKHHPNQDELHDIPEPYRS